MSDAQIPHLEASIMPNVALIKKVFIIGGVLFVAAVGAIIWGKLNWDEYTEVVQDVITGEISTIGLASQAVSWGTVFAIAIPIVYGLMWFSVDFKNPSLGANNQGIFLNREGFKKTFIKWSEFSHFEKKSDGQYRMYMKDPQSVIDRLPGATKGLLKKTYVTDKSPIVIGGELVPEEQQVADLIGKYGPVQAAV